jgi:predicted GNAT family N-acyltransferase
LNRCCLIIHAKFVFYLKSIFLNLSRTADIRNNPEYYPRNRSAHHYTFQLYQIMNTYSTETILSVAQVMADSFKDDPLNQTILRNISKKDKLLFEHSLIHVKQAVKTKSLRLLDGDPQAFLVGIARKDERAFKEMVHVVKVYLKTLGILGFRDLKTILANNKKTKKVVNFSWQKEFIEGEYYRIKIVAVDKSLRGTGAFRRLMTPVLESCDRKKIPVILETHNYTNVGLYNHFGFELVKTIESNDTDIKQYCMIRKPRGSKGIHT